MINEKHAEADEKAFQHAQRIVFASRFDANETIFLERQLTQLRTKTFMVDYAPTIARTLGPLATDIAPYANQYSYGVFSEVGQAKIGNYNAKDIPRVDANATEVLGKVVPIVDGFAWNIGELSEAARLGLDLSGTKMKAASDAIERGIDSVIAFGTMPDNTGALPALASIQGLANNPDVVSQGIISLGFWSGGALASSLVLSQLSGLVAQIANTTNSAYNADTVLLPTAHYNYVAQTPFSTLSGESILSVFRRNNPQITMVAPWWKLNAAGASGVPRAIAYQRNSAVLELIIPLDFTVMPPEVSGFEMLYNCHARCGGTKIYRPMGVKYGDFLLS